MTCNEPGFLEMVAAGVTAIGACAAVAATLVAVAVANRERIGAWLRKMPWKS